MCERDIHFGIGTCEIGCVILLSNNVFFTVVPKSFSRNIQSCTVGNLNFSFKLVFWNLKMCEFYLCQGFPACTRRSSRWYMSTFYFFTKTWICSFSSLCNGLCFSIHKFSCNLLFLLYRNIIIFDELLANLSHMSTNWWKVNKSKNLILNLLAVFYCYFNVYYSSVIN